MAEVDRFGRVCSAIASPLALRDSASPSPAPLLYHIYHSHLCHLPPIYIIYGLWRYGYGTGRCAAFWMSGGADGARPSQSIA
eukprot:scaffold2214_cov128-Isochrysis_galbana.AAC.3